MTALLKFLKVLILGGLALALAGAVIGAGYWQYTRQAELLDGFEYMAWDSDYQKQIKTIEDGQGREFKVMRLARRYSDHWVVANPYPDDYVSSDGESYADHIAIVFYWDAECIEGTSIDLGVKLGDGSAELDCIDGDKLGFFVRYGTVGLNLWSNMPDRIFNLGGYTANSGFLKYWPWDEAKKFATLQKATMSSDAD